MNLPADYRHYLSNIPIYQRPEEGRQKLGAAIFSAIFGPVMTLVEKLVNATIRKDGYAPLVVIWLVRSVVIAIWSVHDNVFLPIFGRGDGLVDGMLEVG